MTLIEGLRVREVSNQFWTREPRTGVVLRISRDLPTTFRWDDGTISTVGPLGVAPV